MDAWAECAVGRCVGCAIAGITLFFLLHAYAGETNKRIRVVVHHVAKIKDTMKLEDLVQIKNAEMLLPCSIDGTDMCATPRFVIVIT